MERPESRPSPREEVQRLGSRSAAGEPLSSPLFSVATAEVAEAVAAVGRGSEEGRSWGGAAAEAARRLQVWMGRRCG